MSLSEVVHVFLSGGLRYKRSKFFIMMGGLLLCCCSLRGHGFQMNGL